jgi:Protein of unknown function (DUF3752)
MIGPAPPAALAVTRTVTTCADAETSSPLAASSNPLKKQIGPALPPNIDEQPFDPAARKRTWEVVRPSEAAARANRDDEGVARDSAMVAREEWMIVPPEVNEGSLKATARSFLVVGASREDVLGTAEWTATPASRAMETSKAILHVSAVSLSHADDDDEEEVVDVELRAKKPRVDDTTSSHGVVGRTTLLAEHQWRIKRKNCEGVNVGPFTPFDREKVMGVQHKRRDSASYINKYGGLNSRYSSSKQ